MEWSFIESSNNSESFGMIVATIGNGLVFQTQVAYLIPIFGIIFGYFLMDEIITWRVLLSLVIILLGVYIFKKNNKG